MDLPQAGVPSLQKICVMQYPALLVEKNNLSLNALMRIQDDIEASMRFTVMEVTPVTIADSEFTKVRCVSRDRTRADVILVLYYYLPLVQVNLNVEQNITKADLPPGWSMERWGYPGNGVENMVSHRNVYPALIFKDMYFPYQRTLPSSYTAEWEETYYQHGRISNERGPAVVNSKGLYEYRVNGYLHRDGDLPAIKAIVYNILGLEFFKDGLRQRLAQFRQITPDMDIGAIYPPEYI